MIIYIINNKKKDFYNYLNFFIIILNFISFYFFYAWPSAS